MSQAFTLQPFTPLALDLSVTGDISRAANRLAIRYQLQGDLGAVVIPTLTNRPQRRFALWEATCFEFFLAPVGEPQYWEFNLSPSGDWNVFRLAGYRQGLQEEVEVIGLPLVIQQTPEQVAIELEFNLDLLVTPQQALEVSVTTVIQQKSGQFSYWALQHTGSEADFHRRSDFAIAL